MMKKLRLEEQYLKNLRRKILRKKTAPLTSNELDFFAHLLEREFYSPELHQVIWDITWKSPANVTMMKIAKKYYRHQWICRRRQCLQWPY